MIGLAPRWKTSKRGNRWHGGRCPVSGDSRQPGDLGCICDAPRLRAVRLTLCGRLTGRKLEASDESRRRGKQNAGQRRGTQTRGTHYHTPSRQLDGRQPAAPYGSFLSGRPCPRPPRHTRARPGPPDAARFEHVSPSLARACIPIRLVQWPTIRDNTVLCRRPSPTAPPPQRPPPPQQPAACAASSTSADLPPPQASGVISRSRRLSL